jgi:hypothetical protein
MTAEDSSDPVFCPDMNAYLGLEANSCYLYALVVLIYLIRESVQFSHPRAVRNLLSQSDPFELLVSPVEVVVIDHDLVYIRLRALLGL